MLQSMQNRLDEIQARYFEIEKLMSQNDIASDPNSIRKLGREYSQLQTIVDLWSDINQNEKNSFLDHQHLTLQNILFR